MKNLYTFFESLILQLFNIQILNTILELFNYFFFLLYGKFEGKKLADKT